MAYTPVTSINSPALTYFQWSTPLGPNPRLASGISATATTIKFTNAPRDRNGDVITAAFLFGIKRTDGYVETVYVPASGLSINGLTATGCVRGIRRDGLDVTTGDASLAVAHLKDEPVFCNISATIQAINLAALIGSIGSLIKFNGRMLFMGSGVNAVPVFADDTARNAALTSPQNGDSCYITADGVFKDYQGGNWASRASGVNPNASPTVAGKVEITTQTEFDAGTDTGGTGAYVVPPPSVIQIALQKGASTYATTGGTTTAYTLTWAPALTAYVTGMRAYVIFNATNTGTSTININGLGAKTIKKNTNQDVAAGDLTANNNAVLMYDGTNFVILSISSPYNFLTTKGDLIVASTANTVIRLGVGSNGQVLMADSAQTSGMKWANPDTGLISAIYTDVTVSGTTSETNLVSVSIPANTLGSGNAVRARLYIDSIQIDSSRTLTVRYKYGATTIVTEIITNSTGNDSTNTKGYLDVLLIAAGATNAQEGSIQGMFVVNGVTQGAADSISSIFVAGTGTAAEDSTTAKNLIISVQFNDSDDGLVMRQALIEKIT